MKHIILDFACIAVSLLAIIVMLEPKNKTECYSFEPVQPVVKQYVPAKMAIPQSLVDMPKPDPVSLYTPELHSEYPVACKIWNFLKDNGFSDNVTAGILGNMMAEVGGQTFEIRPEIYDAPGDYYGICQWNRWNYAEVQGKPLDFQLDFLIDTIHSRFSDSEYERFLNSDNPRIAALRFAIWYEGCAEWSYPVRESNAQKAYDYFAEVN